MADIFVRNLADEEFVASGQSEFSIELNGNQVLTLTLFPNKVNDSFIRDIDNMWEIEYYGTPFKVVYTKKHTIGDSFYIDVRAIHSALDNLDSIRTYERYDGSITSQRAFAMTFDGTEYRFELLDQFSAIEIEGLGDGETKLESFKRLLNRFGAEFYISGRTFYISNNIGRDTDFEYRYKLNASNVQEETDGTTTYTYAKGYGDYDENEENVFENAKIKRTYESPLSNILGRRHGPVVKKGSYKTNSAVDKALKELVDNSVTISVSADVKDLREQGYPYAQPEVGDRVFLNDERIDFNQEVRVVELNITRYANGKVRDINVVFGNQKLSKRYASKLSSAVANIEALLNGKLELQFDVLDQVSKDMLKKIMSVDSELVLDNGIFAVDKKNPNNVVGLNSAGWFISKDGGKTATTVATSDGIVAESIVGKSLFGLSLTSSDKNGYFNVTGSHSEFVNMNTGAHLNMYPSGLYGYNTSSEDKPSFRLDKTLVTSSAVGTSIANVYLGAQAGNEARVVNFEDIPGDGLVGSYRYLPLRASGFYGNFWNINPAVNGINLYARPLSGGELRVTLNGTTDNYQDVRAEGIYANHLTLNALEGVSSNLLIRPLADGEVRIVSNGTEDNYKAVRAEGYYGNYWNVNTASSGSAANLYARPLSGGELRVTLNGTTDNYQDVRANHLFGNSLSVNSLHGYASHLYLKTIDYGELRVVSTSSSDVYRDVRAKGFFGSFIDRTADVAGIHLYVRPAGSPGEVRITVRGTTNVYRPIRASDFVTDTSVRDTKENIEVYDTYALDYIRAMNVYTYNRKTDEPGDRKQLGAMIEELPEETHSSAGDSFALYALTSFLAKGIKDITVELDELRQEFEEYKHKQEEPCNKRTLEDKHEQQTEVIENGAE